MKKRILLMDTLSTIHVGNGALLENTIKLCNDAYGDCEFDIITMDRETNALKYDSDKLHAPMFGDFWSGLGGIGKILWAFANVLFLLLHIINENTFGLDSKKLTFTKNQKKAIEVIEQTEICVSCGGEIIGDTFFQALPFWLFSYWLAIKKGKVLILFPQSIGPLKMFWTRKLVYHALRDAALLVGRDKASYETLLSLGFSEDRVMLVPDVAIQQEIAEADIHDYFKDRDKRVIGITISNPPHNEMGLMIDFVKEVGEQVKNIDRRKYKILIMPSNYKLRGVSRDYALCLKLKEELSGRFETSILDNRPYFPGEYTGILSQLEQFISTRMHVAILATSALIPTIAINTQHKIKGYMTIIGMEDYCVDYDKLNTIHSLVEEIEQNRNTIVEKLYLANKTLKGQHRLFVNRVQELHQ